MLLEIRSVDHHDLFVLAHRKRVIPLLIDTLGADPDAIPYGLPARDLKGLVRPTLNRNCHPCGLVALGEAVKKIPRDCHWISPKLLLDDARVPDRVETVHARSAFPDEI